MMRFIVAVVVFFVVKVIVSFGLLMLNFHDLGIISLLAGLIAAIIVFVRMGSNKQHAGGEPVQGNAPGNATFSWKGVSVYREDGYFSYHGRKYQIDKITRVSYETSGYRGCMGGTHYSIFIHMNDIATPRVTIGAGNVTVGGNRQTEENYERLCLALGIRN